MLYKYLLRKAYRLNINAIKNLFYLLANVWSFSYCISLLPVFLAICGMNLSLFSSFILCNDN